MAEPGALESRLRQMFPEIAEAQVDRVGMLSDVQREPVWQHLRAIHCAIAWVAAGDLPAHAAEGWHPVLARRGDASFLFLDRNGGQVLMSKAPAGN